jgi:GNAT superfamily N-acetyltransferase
MKDPTLPTTADRKASVTLTPLTESDIAAVIPLAQSIWRAHYTRIIGEAQVEYMLASRFTEASLRSYIGANSRWLDVLRVDGVPVGFLSYARTEAVTELKLEQLYLTPALHGIGLGGRMLRHAEARARALGCAMIMLQVNKRNEKAITVYRRSGYTVREEAVFDIGQGYVMDDYLMEKRMS